MKNEKSESNIYIEKFLLNTMKFREIIQKHGYVNKESETLIKILDHMFDFQGTTITPSELDFYSVPIDALILKLENDKIEKSDYTEALRVMFYFEYITTHNDKELSKIATEMDALEEKLEEKFKESSFDTKVPDIRLEVELHYWSEFNISKFSGYKITIKGLQILLRQHVKSIKTHDEEIKAYKEQLEILTEDSKKEFNKISRKVNKHKKFINSFNRNIFSIMTVFIAIFAIIGMSIFAIGNQIDFEKIIIINISIISSIAFIFAIINKIMFDEDNKQLSDIVYMLFIILILSIVIIN